MYIQLHEAKIPARGLGGAAEIDLITAGAGVVFTVRTSDPKSKKKRATVFEMNVKESLLLIEGILDALHRCNFRYMKRNAFLRKMEMHPE